MFSFCFQYGYRLNPPVDMCTEHVENYVNDITLNIIESDGTNEIKNNNNTLMQYRILVYVYMEEIWN